MLLRFRVSNFASLRDEQELSLVALDEHPDLATAPVPREDLRTLPVVGIFGANASGKSNVIKALEFARDAVRYSHQRWLPDDPIPRWPFRLDDDSVDRPSEFIFDLVIGEVRYTYGFAVDDEVIQREWLYAFPKGRRQVYFERDRGSLRFGNNLTGHRERIADAVRPNSLFLSAAAANNHAQLGAVYQWFGPNNTVSAYEDSAAWSVRGPIDDRTLALVQFADLGIVGARSIPLTLEQREYFRGLLRDSRSIPASRQELLHRARTRRGNVALPAQWESTGTETWLDLLGCVLPRLDAGGLLTVDDLGSGLHPLLVAQLIRVFHDPATNPRCAQLLFNSHDTGLLGRHQGVQLARDQVWLTEKDEYGATRLFPLTEFRVRDKRDDVEGRYLKGRYGAVPFFDDDLLAALTESSYPAR
jgi:hypothetical protein